jgi:hypothetical protein
MRATTLALALLCGPATPQAGQDRKDPELVAFDEWRTEYLRGVIALDGVRSMGELRRVARLCESLARREDTEGVTRLCGLLELSLREDPAGDVKEGPSHPWQVVAEAERTLGLVVSRAAIQHVIDELERCVAHATLRESLPGAAEQVRIVARLRAVGCLRTSVHWPLVARFLISASPEIRRVAGETLGRLKSAAAVPSLSTALAAEKVEAPRMAQADALRSLLQGRPDADPRQLRSAVAAVCGALGRGSWRAELALVQFLRYVRSADAVPPLLDAFERALARRTEQSATSGSLVAAIHEALVDLTGFYAPIDKPAAWREWWAAARETFTLPPSKAERDLAAESRIPQGQRTVTSFFGIPVTGSRVVFVLDVSRSMSFPFGTGTEQTRSTRMDEARRELLRVVSGLPPTARFNLVLFSEGYRTWKSDLVSATESNKIEFRAFVERIQPELGTNLFAGLDHALGIKSAQPGDRYATNVDEVVVLSDGAPSVGKVVRTDEILRLVSETNRYARVTIHTVFIGPKVPIGQDIAHGALSPYELMEQLARSNGGKFAAR